MTPTVCFMRAICLPTPNYPWPKWSFSGNVDSSPSRTPHEEACTPTCGVLSGELYASPLITPHACKQTDTTAESHTLGLMLTDNLTYCFTSNCPNLPGVSVCTPANAGFACAKAAWPEKPQITLRLEQKQNKYRGVVCRMGFHIA